MNELRFGVFGAGFWAPFHMAGWKEVAGARSAAIYNRTRSKAQIFQPDWKKVFEPEALRESVAKITGKLPR